MHTDSSASSTCFWLKSAVECTATVLIPSSRQARRMRRAISPRLAMTTFSSMTRRLFDDEEGLAEFDRIAVAGHDGGDPARAIRLDLIHHLHGLDDAEHLAHFHLIADFHERLGARRRA